MRGWSKDTSTRWKSLYLLKPFSWVCFVCLELNFQELNKHMFTGLLWVENSRPARDKGPSSCWNFWHVASSVVHCGSSSAKSWWVLLESSLLSCVVQYYIINYIMLNVMSVHQCMLKTIKLMNKLVKCVHICTSFWWHDPTKELNWNCSTFLYRPYSNTFKFHFETVRWLRSL